MERPQQGLLRGGRGFGGKAGVHGCHPGGGWETDHRPQDGLVHLLALLQRLFKQLGTVGPEKTVVYLKDVQPRHLDFLIQYMYRGEIKVEVRQPAVQL